MSKRKIKQEVDLVLLFELFSIVKQRNQIDKYFTSIVIGQKSTNQIAQYMVESWRGFRTLLSTLGTFGEYSDIVDNDIFTRQRFLDARFLYSVGWQVWKVVLGVFTKVVLRQGINATQRYPLFEIVDAKGLY